MHSSISTAMAMMAFAGFVYFLSDRISLNALVKSALPLTLCGFLLIPSEGFLGTVVSSYMISAGYSFMTLLIALMLYDISKRFGIMVLLLFCLKNAMQIFVVWGKDFAGMIERSGLTPGTQEAVLIIIVVALISSMAFISTPKKALRPLGASNSSKPTSSTSKDEKKKPALRCATTFLRSIGSALERTKSFASMHKD